VAFKVARGADPGQMNTYTAAQGAQPPGVQVLLQVRLARPWLGASPSAWFQGGSAGAAGGETNPAPGLGSLTALHAAVTLPLPQADSTVPVSQRCSKRAPDLQLSRSPRRTNRASHGPAGDKKDRGLGGSRRNQAPLACRLPPPELARVPLAGCWAGGRLLATAGWLPQAGSDRSPVAGKGKARPIPAA